MIYEQTAMQVTQIDQAAKIMSHTFDLESRSDWVRDRVEARHIWVSNRHPAVHPLRTLDVFTVALAFHYDFVKGQELELIEPLEGRSCQLLLAEPGQIKWPRLAHLGYHLNPPMKFGEGEEPRVTETPTPDHLIESLHLWRRDGFEIVQVSQTENHQNTTRRYLYAFVDTRALVGAYTKIIQRYASAEEIPPIEQTVQMFEAQLGETRRG